MARKKLTDAAVNRLKAPESGRTDYWDAMLPGFGLRITDKGAKSWVVMYRVGGRLRRLTLGSYPAISLKDARREAGEAMREAAKGNDPATMKALAKHQRVDTFKEVAEEFIERHAKRNTRSWKATESILNRNATPSWGSRPIGEITRRDVIEALDKVMDRGEPYAANRLLAAVRKLFNWALERDIIDTSPVANIKAPGKESQRDRVLNDDEIKALWAACEKAGYPYGPLVKMLLLTAQRRDEVATMRWSDISKEAKLWTIPSAQTKADRAQEVPLSPLAIEILEALPRQSGPYIFTTTGGELPVSGFSKAKKGLEKLVDFDEWRLHDVRRTSATNMARLGVPGSIIGRVLNHAQRGVTAIYDRHTYLPEKRHALETWANKLASIIKPKDDDKVVQLQRRD